MSDELQRQVEGKHFKVVGADGRIIDSVLSRDQVDELKTRLVTNVAAGLVDAETLSVEEYDGADLLDTTPWSAQ